MLLACVNHSCFAGGSIGIIFLTRPLCKIGVVVLKACSGFGHDENSRVIAMTLKRHRNLELGGCIEIRERDKID